VSSKYAVVVIVIMAAILLTGFGRTSVHADTDLVTDIEHSPDPVVAGNPVEISCKVSDETDVTSVVLNMCSSLYCFPPNIMEKGTDNIWRATNSDVGDVDEYHYNITIHFSNGTKVWTDDIYFDAVSTDLETDVLEHVPSKVIVGEEIDVYTTLTDDTGASDVSLYHCQGDVCFAPVTMTKLANGTYHTRLGPFDNTLEEVKYNVTVTYTDGHKAWTGDIKFTPAKKSSGNDDDDDNGIIPALGAVAVLAVLTALAVTRRGKKGEK